MKKIRVLVVDDSAFMRRMLAEMIDSDLECEVIKAARDGIEALVAVEELKPDVVTLDIEIPEIYGLTCLIYIMSEFPTPVIVVTGFSRYLGEETIKALEYGAVGFVSKPGGPGSRDVGKIKEELVSQIKHASRVDARKLRPMIVQKAREQIKKPLPKTANKIVVIAASTGGPRSLARIIPGLPAGLAAGVLVAQHMPEEFIGSFAERLNWESEIDVKEAEDSEPVRQGMVMVMPANCCYKVESKGENAEALKFISYSGESNFQFNAIDGLMASLAPIYGKNATGVILTGMGNDGVDGLRAIKEYGGHTIAEDESTCVIYGMPKAAVEAGVVDKVLPADKIADEIVRTINVDPDVKKDGQ